MAAIYQWFVGHEIVVTTTPYPVDVQEAIVFGVTLSAGNMSLLPREYLKANPDVISASHYQNRWFYEDGPYDDSLQANPDVISANHYQGRWFYEDGPYDDSLQANPDVVSAQLLNKLVEADTPDEMLQLNCTISATCSMDLV